LLPVWFEDKYITYSLRVVYMVLLKSTLILPPTHPVRVYTDKKENKVFLIYKEIQMGSGAKSYLRKGFLIYEVMHKFFPNI
jgi:hypothetical protein